MKIYEIFDEDYNQVVDMAEEIKNIASHMVKCLDKAKERDEIQGGEMNFRRRAPRMRGGRGGGQGSFGMYPQMRGGQAGYTDVPPHMRGGYIVRPEEDDWMYNERYNW